MRPIAAGAAFLLAGCSADIARFEYPPTFNLTEGRSATGSTSPSAGMVRQSDATPTSDSAPPAYRPSGNSIYTPPRAERPKSFEMAALPEPQGASQGSSQRPSASPPAFRPASSRPDTQSVRTQPINGSTQPASNATGGTITVQAGDTLYGLSKKHHVSISELMSVNGLSSPRIKPGQELRLPGPGASTVAAGPASPRPQRTPVRPALAAAPASGGSGTYTIKPGDSLYRIARQNGTTVAKLKEANPGADPRALRPGTVLQLPGAAAPSRLASAPTAPAVASVPPPPPARAPEPPAQPARVAAPAAPAPSAPASANEPKSGAATSVMPTIVNGPTAKVAANATETATDARPTVPALPKAGAKPVKVAEIRPDPAPSAQSLPPMAGKLRWPAKGKVVANFGARPDGTHNDGVNLAVPLGTEVHAAENGVVAYAGNELKGYGNLILVRHDNGWVTAYAHNDQLMVKRGEKVRRGQIIAKAGKTGTVDQPQVHFELRLGSKPVDPLPYMEKS
jgi:murein DD-endopeptidase MepM/ murein hydrolase activator NlpD